MCISEFWYFADDKRSVEVSDDDVLGLSADLDDIDEDKRNYLMRYNCIPLPMITVCLISSVVKHSIPHQCYKTYQYVAMS